MSTLKNISLSHDIATHVLIQIDPRDFVHVELIQKRLIGSIVTFGTIKQWILFGKEIKVKILKVIGNTDCQYKKIHENKTQFEFQKSKLVKAFSNHDEKDIYVTSLKDIISSSFDNSSLFSQMGMPIAKSILIHGVSGVGKTTLIHHVAELLDCTVFEVSAYDLLSFDDEEYDFPEFSNYNTLTLTVNKAIQCVPSIVMIKNLDALGTGGDKTRKILDIFSQQVDRIGSNTSPVCIIGLAQELRSLPDLLKKTEIFRQHMLLPIPTAHQRKAVLKQILKEVSLKAPSIDLSEPKDVIDYYATQISFRTSGYVARDLTLLVRQAKLKRSRTKLDIVDQLEQLSIEGTGKQIQWSDFEYAIESYHPSQKSTVESTLPKRDWNELGGYEKIKNKMRQAILLPLSQPHVFTKLGIKPPSGLLLYGPSGCGKTAFVQALVSESMMNVISIKGPEIFSKYLGETENKIRKLFATAKRISPCIIFIDEMDAIGTKRGFDMGESSGGVNERVLSTLLNEMDGVEGRQGVVVIGCTNRPDQIDDAILRPGRLDQLLYLGLPTLEDRKEIIQALMNHVSVAKDIVPEDLAKETEFCSGADLENLFREAGTVALRQDIHANCITKKHIQSVIIPICERAEDQILEGRLDIYEKFLHDHNNLSP